MNRSIQSSPGTERVLDALGNQTRRDILALLHEQPLAVGAIARQLPISRPAVSKHLRILQGAGLVAHSADGTRNVFYLNRDGFQAVQAYLEQFWDEALLNFKRLAEGTDGANP